MKLSYALLVAQIAGVTLALIGAWFSAGSSVHERRLGFWLYLAANATLGAYVVLTAQWPMAAMYAVFLVTSIRGIRNNRG